MALWKTHPREDLLRYLDGTVEDNEKRALEEHLTSCKECRDYISMVKGFNQGLAGLTEEEFTSQEPCPDSWTLVSYEGGKVDEETARHLRAHLLFCDDCAEEFYALRRLSEDTARGEAEEASEEEMAEQMQPQIVDVILRVAGSLIEVFHPPETLVWESRLVTVPVKGEIVPSAPFRMAQTLVDDDRNKATVAVRVELGVEPEHVRVVAQAETVSPEWKWRASLLDGKEEEWASMPLDSSEVQMTSGIPFGLYTLEVTKGDNSLGIFKFTVESIKSHEAIEKAREYVETEDYLRASVILQDALRRDSGNESLLQEMNRVNELAHKKESEDEEPD